MKKPLIIILSILIAFTAFLIIDGLIARFSSDNLAYNTTAVNLYDEIDIDAYDADDYYTYVESFDAHYPNIESIVIPAATVLEDEDAVHTILDRYEGVSNPLLTEETGTASWEVNIAEAGFYQIKVNYFPYEGKSSSIERKIYLNDEIPFDGANQIIFYRIWANESDVETDIYGNDIRPSQVEKPMWTSTVIKDSVGYVSEPYSFYFNEGINKISLESIREPMLIESIEIQSVKTYESYDEVLSTYEQNGYQSVDQAIEMVQAEHALYTTSPTLYALNDRTSPLTMSSDPSLVKLNTIGGTNWRVSGDKITWAFEVTETGLYEISMRLKQKLASGMNVSRNIYIDGEIPFEEMQNYAFQFDNDWRIQTLGEKDEAYQFYLEQGMHTITLEVTLGQYGPLIAQIQNSITKLNELYREILVYTGPEPDEYRDYELETRIDNLVERLDTERENLSDIRQTLIDISGSKSEKTGILDTVILQLEDFVESPREIHKNLSTYSSNISSLGTLVILLSEQPLEIDYLMIHGENAYLPQAKASFFKKMIYNIRSFFASFTTDYASIGQTSEDGDYETIEVWLSVGKDQTNIVRKMIDESFTPNTDIQVDLKLVNSAVLLPATLAGEGPDVAMGVGYNIPVNYAMRNAVYDLSQFEDFDEISQRFMDSAMVGFEHEGGYYALPEQQIFLMMFYRTDIFEDLGLGVPNTWEEVIEMIPDLQKHNLEFYLPVPITQGAVINLPPNPIFSTMFYQNDGEFYINDNTESGFNEGMGPQIFDIWTQFYTDYSFPVEANFVNRFRSGQMPIGVTYYNVYNTLSVFAPEIRGKWDFVAVPGTEYVDSEGETQIRRDTVSTNTGAIIMDKSDHIDASWEFLKWWTSTDIQVQFGREMEGILGAAARYPTANVDALSQLPWTVNEYEKLYEQWQWVKGIPEVPGGYMTGRHLDNAFRLVINDYANPRETIYDYVQIINEEIAKKRREFGLE